MQMKLVIEEIEEIRRENQKNNILLVFYYVFHYLTKKWKWSYGQYTHSGIRVRPKTRENDKFEKKASFSQK